MNIIIAQLKRIIKEELKAILDEEDISLPTPVNPVPLPQPNVPQKRKLKINKTKGDEAGMGKATVSSRGYDPTFIPEYH